jgi:3-oxoadipate CoA-transferase beta subunit
MRPEMNTQNALALAPLSRRDIARRIAHDIEGGWYVNLGIGIPTLIADVLPQDREIVIHSENGVLGMGPAPAEQEIDPWLVNAGKGYVTLLPGGAFVHQADSFVLVRGGHLDLCVLGAFEVAGNGDVANWATSLGKTPPAVGGAMDLAAGAKRLWVAMEHETRDGRSRLVERCTLPLTAMEAVDRIYTNLALIEVRDAEFHVLEMIAGLTPEALQDRTAAKLNFSSLRKNQPYRPTTPSGQEG